MAPVSREATPSATPRALLRDTGVRLLHVACELVLVTFIVAALWCVRFLVEWSALPDTVQRMFEYVHVGVAFASYLSFALRNLVLLIFGGNAR